MADSDFLNEFVVEAREHLENGEACLLRLISDPSDHEAVQACFRTVHTLKGLAGFLSLERVQAVAHAAEQVLDRLRTEPTPCTPAQGDALLLTITRLRELVDGLESGTPPPEDDRDLIALLEATNHASSRPAPEKDPYQPSPGASQRQEATSRRYRTQGAQAAPRTPVVIAAPAVPVATVPSDVAQGMSLDTVLGELIGMAADDLMGITRVLMDLDGLASAWPPGARTLLMTMKGLGDRMLESTLGAEGLAQILAHAERLPAAVAGAGAAVADAPAADGDLVPEHQAADFAAEALELLSIAEAALLDSGAASNSGAPNHDQVEAVLRAFHTIKGMAAYLELPRLERFAHRLEDELMPVREGRAPFTAALATLALAAVDALRALAAQVRQHRHDRYPWPTAAHALAAQFGLLVDGAPAAAAAPVELTVAEALVASGVPAAVVAEAAKDGATGEELTTRLVRAGRITPAKAEEVLVKQREAATAERAGAETFTRVSIARLEELVNLVGELLITQAMVSQSDEVARSAFLQQAVGRQTRIVRDLQNLSLGLRMVPLKGTFQKMARAVHDTARKLGKPITLDMVGDDTEIDRTLAETLPITHKSSSSFSFFRLFSLSLGHFRLSFQGHGEMPHHVEADP